LCHTVYSEANYIPFWGIVNTLQGMGKLLTKFIVFAILGLILVLALSVFRSVSRSSQISTQIQIEKTKLAKIEADNQKLQDQLTLTQNPSFIEKEVRDKLGLGKAGEAIVVLPDAEILKKLAPKVQLEEDNLPDPNWKKWEKLFF